MRPLPVSTLAYVIGAGCLLVIVAYSQSLPEKRESANEVQQQAQPKLNPSTSGDGIGSGPDQKKSPRPTDQNENQPQAQVHLAPVDVNPISVNKDKLDWAYVLFGFLLVVVGGLQLWLLKQNANAILNSERARLFVTIGPLPDFIIDPNKVQIMWLHPTVQNHGRTPATITKMRLRAQQVSSVDGLPQEPIYDIQGNTEIRRFDGETLFPPNVTVSILTVGINAHDFVQIRQGASFLYLYGVVEYQDIAKRAFYTRFCFLYHVPGGFNPIPEGFVFGGPSAYNRAT
jgi:hypothetical protein